MQNLRDPSFFGVRLSENITAFTPFRAFFQPPKPIRQAFNASRRIRFLLTSRSTSSSSLSFSCPVLLLLLLLLIFLLLLTPKLVWSSAAQARWCLASSEQFLGALLECCPALVAPAPEA